MSDAPKQNPTTGFSRASCRVPATCEREGSCLNPHSCNTKIREAAALKEIRAICREFREQGCDDPGRAMNDVLYAIDELDGTNDC